MGGANQLRAAPALVRRPPHIAAVPPVVVLTGLAIADAV